MSEDQPGPSGQAPAWKGPPRWLPRRSLAVRTLLPASWRGPLTRDTVTALVASAGFVLLAAIVALAPIPFVGWAPGRTVDVAGVAKDGSALIRVEGLPTTPLNGQLRMTTVAVTQVDSRMTLPEAMFNYWMPRRDVLPRAVVYPRDKTIEQVQAEEVAMMDTSQHDAIVAALRAAGQPVLELPMVSSVSLTGPSKELLRPGDLIIKVDDTAVQSSDDVRNQIRKHKVGESVVFSLERDGAPVTVTVVTDASPKDKAIPYVGISIALGHKFNVKVGYGIDPAIVGPSAGLVFSLAIYDLISEGDVLAGTRVAGTGTIGADGSVGGIGGIQQKIAGAQKAGATVFLVPAVNCQDIVGVRSSMNLVKVASLREAIAALQKLKQNSGEGVPRC